MSEKGREATNSTPASGLSNVPPPPPPPSTYSSGMTTTISTMPAQLPQPSLGSPIQATQYWTVVPNAAGWVAGPSAMYPGSVSPPPKVKSLLESYLLGLPLGFLGAHHFYLGRPTFGVMYLFTLGLLGCGWLIDLLRMPCLVSSVNKGNRERHKQLQVLQQQMQQERLQQEQQYGAAAASLPHVHHNVVILPFEPRSLLDAYILWFPFGLFGFHHFYLRNYGMGVLYLFTFGLLGIGWLVDLFRMPSLVREANSPRVRNGVKKYSQCTGHVFAISPAGILGGHHFYLDRPVWGVLYFTTLGLLGVGWVYDWFRMSCLVKRANAIRQGERSPHRKYVDDAYILCIPFGFTGMHHFYLGRYGWGCLYFFTFGILGIGWLVDWFRLPCLVREHNANLDESQRLLFSNGSGSATGGVGINSGIANQTQGLGSPSVYVPVAAGYGYNQTPYPNQGYTTGNYPGYMGQGYPAPVVAPPSYESTMDTNTAATKN